MKKVEKEDMNTALKGLFVGSYEFMKNNNTDKTVEDWVLIVKEQALNVGVKPEEFEKWVQDALRFYEEKVNGV